MKFVVLNSVTKEEQERIQNKKVCNVTELLAHTHAGIYKGWMGSVEEAYFSVVFTRGVLCVAFEEREMCLGWNNVSYAVVDSLADAYTFPTTKAKQIIVAEYDAKFATEDVETIKFKDVMRALKWKYASRKVKLEEHFLTLPTVIPKPEEPLTIPQIVI